jgi:hypothetical protein
VRREQNKDADRLANEAMDEAAGATGHRGTETQRGQGRNQNDKA